MRAVHLGRELPRHSHKSTIGKPALHRPNVVPARVGEIEAGVMGAFGVALRHHCDHAIRRNHVSSDPVAVVLDLRAALSAH